MTLRTRVRVALTLLILTAGALVMLAVAIPTLFMARRLYAEVIGRRIGEAVLRLWRIEYTVHTLADVPPGQVVFISNHNSTIDIFTLISLALPRTRFFLSGFLRRLVPIGIIGTLIRIFWTVPQEFPERRREIFMRATRILARTGDSVYLSPEGMRVDTGEIGHFNRGAFHLATALRAPIVPIYFHIPPAINPGRGANARPGHLDVYLLPAIDTSEWRVDEVDLNRNRVRDLYVRVHDAMRTSGRLPADPVIQDMASPAAEGAA